MPNSTPGENASQGKSSKQKNQANLAGLRPEEQIREKEGRRNRTIMLIVAIIGALATIIAGMFALFPRPDHPIVIVNVPTALPIQAGPSTPSARILASPTPVPTSRVCNPVDSSQPFSVLGHYDPSGLMGDLGDIADPIKTDQMLRFEYVPKGLPPHEWDYKYVGGVLNEKPAKFGAVMFLYPPNNFGQDPQGGYDLSGMHKRITWDARSANGEAYVEFIIAGVTWVWDDNAKQKVASPYPDSLPRTSLGTRLLDDSWQTFSITLPPYEDEKYACIIGGFGMVIKAGTAVPDYTYVIEVRNIYYEK